MRKLVFLLITMLCLQTAQAQEVYNSSGNKKVKSSGPSKKGFDAGKLVIGGNVGLFVGKETWINIAPKVGYRILDNLAAGVGMGYQYYGIRDYYYLNYPYRSSMFSPSVWVWYVPVNFLFVNTEYVHNFATASGYYYDYSTNQWAKEKYAETFPALWFGGGFRQHITDNVGAYLGLYYNVLGKPTDPYTNFTYRLGVMIGL